MRAWQLQGAGISTLKLVDAAVPYLELERDDLTQLLVETDTKKRLERIIPSLERQATVLRLKADIGAELEGESSRTHRERVLRDRMRQIQEELGEQDDNAEIDEHDVLSALFCIETKIRLQPIVLVPGGAPPPSDAGARKRA